MTGNMKSDLVLFSLLQQSELRIAAAVDIELLFLLQSCVLVCIMPLESARDSKNNKEYVETTVEIM